MLIIKWSRQTGRYSGSENMRTVVKLDKTAHPVRTPRVDVITERTYTDATGNATWQPATVDHETLRDVLARGAYAFACAKPAPQPTPHGEPGPATFVIDIGAVAVPDVSDE